MGQFFQIWRIAFVYVGTVVGAGFATGKEVFIFFTSYGGAIGGAAIAFATFLFVWLGYRMMIMGARLQASSYAELNHYLLGPRVGQWFTNFISVALLGVTVVMISGIGSLWKEKIGSWSAIGILLASAFTYFIVIKQIQGILVINAWVVPCMVIFSIYIFFVAISDWGTIPVALSNHHWGEARMGEVIWKAILYVGFNLITAQAVLVPLGSAIRHRKTLIGGAALGGLLLGGMLWMNHQVIHHNYARVAGAEMPMAAVLETLPALIEVLFLVVLVAEILTTLVANLYGLVSTCSKVVPLSLSTLTLLFLVVAYCFSLFGFSLVLERVYTWVGYGSLLILPVLCLRSLPLQQGPRVAASLLGKVRSQKGA